MQMRPSFFFKPKAKFNKIHQTNPAEEHAG